MVKLTLQRTVTLIDSNGTDHDNDGNESDYGYNDENMSDDNRSQCFT